MGERDDTEYLSGESKMNYPIKSTITGMEHDRIMKALYFAWLFAYITWGWSGRYVHLRGSHLTAWKVRRWPKGVGRQTHFKINTPKLFFHITNLQDRTRQGTMSPPTLEDLTESMSSLNTLTASARIDLLQTAGRDGVQTSRSLEVKPSNTRGGLGIFTTKKISAGEEVFRIDHPQLYVPSQLQGKICDYCLYSDESAVDKNSGHIWMSFKKHLALCNGCKKMWYCSKVNLFQLSFWNVSDTKSFRTANVKHGSNIISLNARAYRKK